MVRKGKASSFKQTCRVFPWTTNFLDISLTLICYVLAILFTGCVCPSVTLDQEMVGNAISRKRAPRTWLLFHVCWISLQFLILCEWREQITRTHRIFAHCRTCLTYSISVITRNPSRQIWMRFICSLAGTLAIFSYQNYPLLSRQFQPISVLQYLSTVSRNEFGNFMCL